MAEMKSKIAQTLLIVSIAALVTGGTSSAQELIKRPVPEPVLSNTGPNATEYGAAEGYPLGTFETTSEMRHLVASFSRHEELTPTRIIPRAVVPWTFRRAAVLDISYNYGGERRTVAEYLRRNPTTGLLIAKDDTIFYEHYQYARTDRDRFASQSMAKTITGMLIGIAVADGAIKSIDDPAATYVPELAATEYGRTPIRALLNMSSGVDFKQTFNGQDDSARLYRDLFGRPGKDPVSTVTQFNSRVAPPNTKWHYSDAESEILGLILRRATGMPIADYLNQKIWQPIGAEGNATWAIDGTGQEVTFCCFNAVLRDYARLARLLAHDGTWNGRQIIPRQWLIDATSARPSDSHLAPGKADPFYGYGYQIWLFPGPGRRFALLGVHGQMIFVDPETKLILVHTAVRPKPVDPATRETRALWSAVLNQLGESSNRRP